MQTDVVDITIWRDILWILMCGFMVALMQAGFTCLESGLVRSKNSINVAIKNLIDFCISIAIYTVFGFGIMFGASYSGLIGTSHFYFWTICLWKHLHFSSFRRCFAEPRQR